MHGGNEEIEGVGGCFGGSYGQQTEEKSWGGCFVFVGGIGGEAGVGSDFREEEQLQQG